MSDYFRQNKKKIIIKGVAVLISLLFLLAFPEAVSLLNKKVESSFYFVKGESAPDSNIVILEITSLDVDNIGPWPIKRSYYALLINSLSKYNVKAIGLEIFLSAKFVTQSIYDNLLTNEIKKSGKVVLSSVAGKIIYKDDEYSTDSLSYSTPKLINPEFTTGHVNYISERGIEIPLLLHGIDTDEKAFSLQLAGDTLNKNLNRSITVNFISSWKKFKKYSLLEYFEMVQKNRSNLESLKNKYVLIGVSDPQVASKFKTYFDDEVPGVALHAFALDNLLNNRYIKNNYYSLSLFILILAAGDILFIRKKSNSTKQFLLYLISFTVFLVFSFIIFSFFHFQLNYFAFLFPLFFFVLIDYFFFRYERKILLKAAVDETLLLKSLLKKKEGELEKLQKELSFDGLENASLMEKIKSLKEDITRLREKELDKEESPQAGTAEINNFYGMVYSSKVIDKVAELIKKAAPGKATILITGESGTGKELAARAIHSLSERSNNNFIAVNCGALSDTLLESELFGHVKGAFTGAISDKMGRFEAADKGTIFLDEIAETSENFQVKLLRVIQTGDFEKVGSAKTSHSDIRIVAATNKNLEQAVKERKFREDLYYRLNVIKIELPPLRDRKEDIEILARHFLSNESLGLKLSKAALDALLDYEWKGNVRELEAAIKHASIFAKSAGRNLVQLADLPEKVVKDIHLNFEDLVIESLREKKFSHSSINETASELGNISRTLISENCRGIFFKTYVENNYDLEKTAALIAADNDEQVVERVKSKLGRFLSNIENDIKAYKGKEFEIVRTKFTSKYKNLPQKFHNYLDEIIRRYLK